MLTFSNLCLRTLLRCNSVSSIWCFCGTSWTFTETGYWKYIKSVSRYFKQKFFLRVRWKFFKSSRNLHKLIGLKVVNVGLAKLLCPNVTLWLQTQKYNNKRNSIRPNASRKLVWLKPLNGAWRAGFGPRDASLTTLV